MGESKTSLQPTLRFSTRLHHGKIIDITATDSKTFQLNFTVYRIKTLTSSWPNRRGHHGQIEDSSTRICHGWIRDVVTAHSKIFQLGFIMAEAKHHGEWLPYFFILLCHWPNRNFNFIMAELEGSAGPNRRLSNSHSSWPNWRRHCSRVDDFPTRLRHGRIKDVIVDDSKILQLSFVTAESGTSLQPTLRLSDLASPLAKLKLHFTMAESKGHCSQIEDSLTPFYYGWIGELDRTTYYGQMETIVHLWLIIVEWKSWVKCSFFSWLMLRLFMLRLFIFLFLCTIYHGLSRLLGKSIQ